MGDGCFARWEADADRSFPASMGAEVSGALE